MTDRTAGFWAYGRATVGVVAVANLVPLFCLLVLEWSLADLLVVYWLEWGAIVPIGIAKTYPARLPYLRDYRDVADRLESVAESDDRSVTRGKRTRRPSDS